jgi:F420-non-reducing hydrogenase iron-sulfur subunit
MTISSLKSTPKKTRTLKKAKFEPRIVAFCCEHSSYYAADVAASSGFSYSINIEIIRVPCVGRVDKIHVLSALKKGADGVMITGCMKDQCQFETGSIIAEERMKELAKSLKIVGLGDRIDFQLMGPGMAQRWVEATEAFHEQIKHMGQNPLRKESGTY